MARRPVLMMGGMRVRSLSLCVCVCVCVSTRACAHKQTESCLVWPSFYCFHALCCCCHGQTLKGHGKEVNDICVHPHHPHLILSASKVCSKAERFRHAMCCQCSVILCCAVLSHPHLIVSMQSMWKPELIGYYALLGHYRVTAAAARAVLCCAVLCLYLPLTSQLPCRLRHTAGLQDYSIRLWNINTGCCALLMRGPGAHVADVLTLVCAAFLLRCGCVSLHHCSWQEHAVPVLCHCRNLNIHDVSLNCQRVSAEICTGMCSLCISKINCDQAHCSG